MTGGKSVPESDYAAARDFLFREAELLDGFRLEEWLDLVTDDVTLAVPTRVDREAGSEKPVFSEQSYYLKNGYKTLHERVVRLDKEYAWAENPRSRVRHNITNVRVERGEDPDELSVRNNQLVYRSRGDTDENDLLSAERHSTLRWVDGDLKLAARTVFLDHTILPTKNLTLPLL